MPKHVLRLVCAFVLLCLFCASGFAIDVTVAAKTFPNYNYSGATAKLRIYASDRFTASDGTIIGGGIAGATTGFFSTVNCTVAANVLSCPPVTLKSTTDSTDNPAVTYTVVLFDAAGAKRDLFPLSEFVLSHTLGAITTWSDIANYNSAHPRARIKSAISVGDPAAMASDLGRVRASAPPTDQTQPRADVVGDTSLVPTDDSPPLKGSYARASLPTTGVQAGTLAYVTDDLRGVWVYAGGAGGGWQSVTNYANVRHFGASGSANTYTCSITSGSATLTCRTPTDFSSASGGISQGIYIPGAGAAGAALVTTVTSVAGSKLTLAQAASRSATSVTVQHDDSAAINAAIAAVASSSHLGGEVYFPNGYYRCNAARNATTNSVLTFPARIYTSADTKIQITLRGESVSLAEYPLQQQGVVIDGVQASQLAVTGRQPALFAPAAYSATGSSLTAFAGYGVHFENLMFVVGQSPKITGLQLHNVPAASLRNVAVMVNSATRDDVNEPTTSTAAGIILPGVNNDTHVSADQIFIQGFYYGALASEHTRFENAHIRKNKIGLLLQQSNFPILGDLVIEQCGTVIQAETFAAADIKLRVERNDGAAGQWYGRQTYDFPDPSHFVRGTISYSMTLSNVGLSDLPLTVNGGKHAIVDPYDNKVENTFTTLALSSGWVNFGGAESHASYAKRGGRVYLNGLIKNGTINVAGGATVATLPAGHCPFATKYFSVASNWGAGVVVVLPTCRIEVRAGDAAWVALNQISFQAEQ